VKRRKAGVLAAALLQMYLNKQSDHPEQMKYSQFGGSSDADETVAGFHMESQSQGHIEGQKGHMEGQASISSPAGMSSSTGA